MGGIVSRSNRRVDWSPSTPIGQTSRKSQFQVKEVFANSSSCWSTSAVKTIRTFSPESNAVSVRLSSGLDIILKDTTGTGCYDAVEQPDVDRGPSRLPSVAVDTDMDGRADLLVLDADGDGLYDEVLSRDRAPLSFLAALACDGEAEGSRTDGLRVASTAEDTPKLAEEPLAPGWERVWSQSKQAHYFAHKQSHRVTWDRAEAMAVSKNGDGDARALAPGWKICRSKAQNKVFYHHVSSGRTTWDASEARIGYPPYWRHAADTSPFVDLVHTGTPALRNVQMLLTSTFLSIRTRDRKTRFPSRLEALDVWRVEHSGAWHDYVLRRARLQGLAWDSGGALPGCSPPAKTQDLLPQEFRKGLDTDINEVYLFHGTSPKAALGIAREGLDVRRAAGTACYGQGVYLSECSSKSDEYSPPDQDGVHNGHCAMFLCRAVLGRMLLWPHAEFSEELKSRWSQGSYDSILGDRQQLRGTYREFVLPAESAYGVYPEYLVVYRRCFDDEAW